MVVMSRREREGVSVCTRYGELRSWPGPSPTCIPSPRSPTSPAPHTQMSLASYSISSQVLSILISYNLYITITIYNFNHETNSAELHTHTHTQGGGLSVCTTPFSYLQIRNHTYFTFTHTLFYLTFLSQDPPVVH